MSRVHSLREGLKGLPHEDKSILKALLGLSLVALVLGVTYALLTALARGGVNLPGDFEHKALTLHAGTAFFYWLYFIQAGVVLAFTRVYTEGLDRFVWRRLMWAGIAMMAAGMVINQIATLSGAAVLYSAMAPLSEQYSSAQWVYIGYVLLTVGLMLIGLAAIRTAIDPKRRGIATHWSSVTFASVMWWGLIIVSGIAALNAFVSALLWLWGIAEMGTDYEMKWHTLFHNMHYLPLMSTVLTWYVLAEATTGVKSIFSERISKVAFALYLITIPPTSLYHAFLTPGIPQGLKVVASLLGLLISVPTILVFIIVITSLEASARKAGARGLFGWLKAMPWGNPAFTAMIMAMVCAAAGGAFSNVLLQHEFAGVISDTFFVPAYFHFFTVGTVTLSFLGILTLMIPALFGRPLRARRTLTAMPYVLAFGVYLFGSAGIAAGFRGAPRRTVEMDYGTAGAPDWAFLMALMAVGGTIMTIVLFTYVGGMVATIAGRTAAKVPDPVVADLQPAAPGTHHAWFALVAIVVMVAAMWIFTGMTYGLMTRLTGGA